jgi:hypothetical protein
LEDFGFGVCVGGLAGSLVVRLLALCSTGVGVGMARRLRGVLPLGERWKMGLRFCGNCRDLVSQCFVVDCFLRQGLARFPVLVLEDVLVPFLREQAGLPSTSGQSACMQSLVCLLYRIALLGRLVEFESSWMIWVGTA